MSQQPDSIGVRRQIGIYTEGMRGSRPELPVAFEDLEARAHTVMKPEAVGYVYGSAGGGSTALANRAAFEQWRIVPRVLRDVSQRDLHVDLLGHTLDYPLLLAPVGVLGIVHPDGEIAVARASLAAGVPMILSTVSSHTIEDVAAANGDGTRWFQLYWGRNRDIAASMIRRAENAGYSALVVTLDTKFIAWREHDIQNAYLPFLHGDGLANFLSDPAFRAALPKPPEEDPLTAIRYFASIFTDPSLMWSDLAWLRSNTRLPIVLKGIQHADDARIAFDHGVNAIIVSNHGGRQVDGAVASLDCLEAAVAAAGDMPVLFDSGIRRGNDILKALALGARAVLLGRPYVYGLALAGEAGITHVVQNLLADFDLTVALSGMSGVADLNPDCLVYTPREN
ncbi:MAG: lactate 2-monooxygenase [Longimicrobiales bacterium]